MRPERSAAPGPRPAGLPRSHALERHQPRHRAARLRRPRARPPSTSACARPSSRAISRFPSNTAIAPSAVSKPGRRRCSARPSSACTRIRTCSSLRAERLVVVPEQVPATRAVLAANMETALNAHWDAGSGPGDRIVVVGGGVLGLLVAWLAARMPGAEVTVVDVDPARAAIAACARPRIRPARGCAGRGRHRLPRQRLGARPGDGDRRSGSGGAHRRDELVWRGRGCSSARRRLPCAAAAAGLLPGRLDPACAPAALGLCPAQRGCDGAARRRRCWTR